MANATMHNDGAQMVGDLEDGRTIVVRQDIFENECYGFPTLPGYWYMLWQKGEFADPENESVYVVDQDGMRIDQPTSGEMIRVYLEATARRVREKKNLQKRTHCFN